jgi:hypothetical protein
MDSKKNGSRRSPFKKLGIQNNQNAQQIQEAFISK